MKTIIIEKGGDFKETSIKLNSLNDIYKKCGFKSNSNFGKVHTWNVGNGYYSIFAKNKGRANQENKCELPPPVDNDLFFGKMICIKHSSKKLEALDSIIDLTNDEWEKVYDKLFGGFEDLGDEDSYSEEEEIPEHLKTKDGYMKDGFVVSDEEDENDSDFVLEELSEEEEEEDYETTTDETNSENFEESTESVEHGVSSDNNDSATNDSEHDEYETADESDDELQEYDESENEYNSDSELSLEEYED